MAHRDGTKRLWIAMEEAPYNLLMRMFEKPATGAYYIMGAFSTLYSETLKEITPVFTHGELELMIDLCPERYASARLCGTTLVSDVDCMFITTNKYAKKVDRREIKDKLRSITTAQRWVLEMWATYYHVQKKQKNPRGVGVYISDLIDSD